MTTEAVPETYVPERLLVVRNPYSSNSNRIGTEIDQLAENGWKVEVVNTSPDIRCTEEEIHRTVRHGDAILGGGGDGTANQIGNILLGSALADHGLGHLPFIPLRGGNANDIAHMLNGKRSAPDIMAHGRYTPVHALEVNVQEPDGKYWTKRALGYIGIGATAVASRRLEGVKNTSNVWTRRAGYQQTREALATLRAIGQAKAFTVQEDNSELPPHELKDILALKGNRIAKYGRPHADIAQPEYERVLSRSGGLGRALLSMVLMQQGKAPGEMLSEPSVYTIHSHTGQKMLVQFDGEVQDMLSGSRVTLGLAPRPYYTLSTNL
jgi:diacylglycerol kinase family enzyme